MASRPQFDVPSRSTKNQLYIEALDRIVLRSEIKHRGFASSTTCRKAAITTRVLELIHQVVRTFLVNTMKALALTVARCHFHHLHISITSANQNVLVAATTITGIYEVKSMRCGHVSVDVLMCSLLLWGLWVALASPFSADGKRDPHNKARSLLH
jgi:hypothetical protein